MAKPDVSSSEIAPHPAEAAYFLRHALTKTEALVRAARRRGDERGAIAMETALARLLEADEELQRARHAQDWHHKTVQPCTSCGVTK